MNKKSMISLLPVAAFLVGCSSSAPTEVADQVVFGVVTTLDDNDTIAEAVAVKNGRVLKIGSKDEISRFIGDNTKKYDYGTNYVYPGFLDSHTHTMFAGYRAIGQANVSSVVPPSRAEYKKIIQEFIAKNPNKDKYLAAGWAEGMGDTMDRAFLDEVCLDKPLVLNTSGGHSILLNTKALEYFHIDKDFAKTWGPSLVYVDADGNPTGYMCENPAIQLVAQFETSVAEAKEYILNFQDFAFQNGFTAVSDAGTELMSPNALPAYVELQKENKLKMRTYSYMMVKDNVDDPKARIQEIVNFAKENSGEYFNVVGAKVFLDGVLEAETAWTIDDYLNKPGQHYHGLERFNKKDKMTELIVEASKNKLAVHSHSVGDGATKFFLECIEDAQKVTGDKDQRNAASHLQLVRSEDIQKFADTNTIAVVPPLWSAKLASSSKDIACIGEEKFKTTYPIKSFITKGAKTVFHSDYPVSPMFNIPMSIYMANQRSIPAGLVPGIGGPDSLNNPGEAISRKDAVLSMTKNVAYMWHKENELGSLEVGKIANMTVFNNDLINGKLENLPFTNVVATLVEGNEVFNGQAEDPEITYAKIYEMILEMYYSLRFDWDDYPYWIDYILSQSVQN